MYLEKYTLTIPFELNNNSCISIKNEPNLFNLERYTVEINLNENHKGNFKIYHFHNKEDILPFYANFRKIVYLLNLDASLWSIKLKELNDNNIHEYIRVNYEIDKSQINKNTIYIIPDSMIITSNLKATLIQNKSFQDMISEIKFYYSKRDSLNFDKNKKLKTALNLYSDSYFKDIESRFLIYMTILELLKPSIKREGIGKECAEKIKKVAMEYKENTKVKTNDELKKEIEEIKGSIDSIHYRSIRYCLQHLANENNIEINGYDLDEMINKSYKVRNKFVHRGKIIKEFDDCLAFLTRFIPELLKIEIDKLIN